MIAGLLNKTIEIYSPYSSKNYVGGKQTEFVFKNKTRARKINKSGSRDLENHEIVYNNTKTFQVRIYVDIDNFDRIKFEGKFYRILDIDTDTENQMITIETELVNE